MKKLVIGLCVGLLSMSAYSQAFKSKAYKTGIFVFCGSDLPRNFSYLVERKGSSDTGWQKVLVLKAPRSEADCKAVLLNLPTPISSITKVEDAQVAFVWRKTKSATIIDSLYSHGLDPRYQAVAGCGGFDDNLSKKDIYSYRISKVSANGTSTFLKEEQVAFPANSYTGALQPVQFSPSGKNIRIYYSINDTVNTAGVRLFRSGYEENRFREIEPNVSFKRLANKAVAEVVDASVAEGVTYDYRAIPYDALGNEGSATDTLHIYNQVKPADVAMIQKFDVLAKPERRGMQLQWKLASNLHVVSIDVYRSSSYNGSYEKLASISPNRTDYLDDLNLNPAVTYYYYILVNSGYGTNLPSARVPAILTGNRKNLLPPQNLTAQKKGNVVTLRFQKVEDDTRGYFIYRGRGYQGEMKQLREMVLSTDSVILFTDTLPASSRSAVYTYAVADENTSYAISPMSERVTVTTGGTYLATPTSVASMLRRNSVFLTWKDVAETNIGITGYRIFRSTLGADDKPIETEKVIDTVRVNSHIDSNVTEGNKYYYQVQTIGANEDETSSLSLRSSVSIPEILPITPGQVFAFASGEKATVKWDVPSDPSISKIRVYRALEGQSPTLVKELAFPSAQYEDTGIEKDKTYYYILTTVNSKNKESRATEPVSVKIRS